MSVSRYIMSLLPAWAQSAPTLAQLVGAFGEVCAGAQQSQYGVRRQWLAKTASGLALDQIGKDRGWQRHPGEADEAYRARLVAAYEVGLRSNTLPGMQALLDSLGLQGQVYEHFNDPAPFYDGTYNYDGSLRYDGSNRWAEFSLDLDEPPAPDVLAALLRGVQRIKPAHTRLAGVRFGLPAEDSSGLEGDEGGLLSITIQHTFNGDLNFDGEGDYGPEAYEQPL